MTTECDHLVCAWVHRELDRMPNRVKYEIRDSPGRIRDLEEQVAKLKQKTVELRAEAKRASALSQEVRQLKKSLAFYAGGGVP